MEPQNIYHLFEIEAPLNRVFEVISTGNGLSKWWTESSEGEAGLGNRYSLYFGPGFDWAARVSRYKENQEFELHLEEADEDWTQTKVGFVLKEVEGKVRVDFYHSGWKEANEHFRISTFCWAGYLRLLKEYIEKGTFVEYKERLNI